MAHQPPSEIEAAVRAARREVNRGRWWSSLLWALVGGGAALLVAAGGYIAAGDRVPLWLYPIAGGLITAGAGAAWAARRVGRLAAAHMLDQHYGLADGVSATLAFTGAHRQGGFYDLQRAWTADHVKGLDTAKLRYRPPRWLVVAAVGAPLLAVALGFKGPAPAVVRAQARARHDRELSRKINKKIEDRVRRELDEADPHQRKLMKPDQLARMARRLKASGDREKLLRQYAAMEKNLADRSAAMQQQRAQQLLRDAGARLGRSPATRELGETLKRRQYKKAAKKLEKLKPKKNLSPAQRRERMKRLKAAAGRLAEAARRMRAERQNAEHNRANRGKDQEQDKGEGEADRLAQTMEKIQRSVQAMDKAMSQSASHRQSGSESQSGSKRQSESGNQNKSENQGKPQNRGEPGNQSKSQNQSESERQSRSRGDRGSRSRLDRAAGRVSRSLGDLQRKLGQMAARRGAQRRLQRMRRMLSRAQGAIAGQKPGQQGGMRTSGAGKGGHRAGRGSARNLNDKPTPEGGKATRIKGIKGRGPSRVTTRDADSGSGSASAMVHRPTAAHKHQFESFVHRPDVPEAVKDGVKTYFENIHPKQDQP